MPFAQEMPQVWVVNDEDEERALAIVERMDSGEVRESLRNLDTDDEEGEPLCFCGGGGVYASREEASVETTNEQYPQRDAQYGRWM